MQLVGAKRSFIIRPFLHRSVIYGLLGGFIAALLLAVLVFIAYKQLNVNIAMADVQMPYIVIIGAVVLMGIAISYLSTYFSIRYYLNHKDEQLY